MQLVFGRDAILNIPYSVKWETIKERKQQKIKENNIKAKKKRRSHTYNINDQVLVKTHQDHKYDLLWNGPYAIIQTNNNGTVQVLMGSVSDTINIRNIKLYKE